MKTTTPAQRLAHLKTKGYRAHPFQQCWPIRYADDGGAAYHELSQLAGLREVGAAHEVAPRLVDHRGWYRDAFMDETLCGFVWRLPARNGQPLFIAGFKDENAGAFTLDASRGRVRTFSTERDAARAADELARVHAEEEREHSEKWQEASRANDEREEAREELKAAREEARRLVAALREQREAGAIVPALCEVLRAKVEECRETMREALGRIARHGEAIEELGMAGEF